ncbi:AAA family ATPase [Helicobacter saguini]|uniref:DNA 3'-5' helicase n=1 Tax=Helicobacter saguini TaxID=1548018 RepID=A0A347VV69_9HELI|nr:ATP-dependent helicase [Helicobacter saguini]MWV62550.1 AAA family ATPase [Helicobacter saguini]MWV66776.1 AAA family ATPase [Helicobacter saguini]MWV69127.1 AAA family ATPase [Helicobacter saguini]MWV71318.1 AAA family ATPase [Helicobacter saguini]TLD94172.1 ATP-dependent helicase [Helicobacter saguini]
MKSYLDNLNDEQKMACDAALGHNLVIASAGTGKTSTIVGRICTLLSRGIKPSEILLLTFTNKASSEMISRVAKIFGSEIAGQITAGTFHSVAYKTLRERQKILLKSPRELRILFKSVYEKFSFASFNASLESSVDSKNANFIESKVTDYKGANSPSLAEGVGGWVKTINKVENQTTQMDSKNAQDSNKVKVPTPLTPLRKGGRNTTTKSKTNKVSKENIESRFNTNKDSKQNIESRFHTKQDSNISQNLDSKNHNFTDSIESSEKDTRKNKLPYGYQYLYDTFSLFQNSTTTQDFATWLKEKNPHQEPYIDTYEYIFDEFTKLKREYGYADYNDLLLFFREELQKMKLSNEISYIEVLCDEYQDTNPLQDSIIHAIAPRSLFCVGDYDQSIYAFNGADISIITNFTATYKDAKVFTLEKNYRSTQHILDLANKVIENNPRIYPKKLQVVNTQSAFKPRLLEYDDLYSQYSSIARIIFDLHEKYSIQFNDMAVIYRNNSSADGLEASLKALGIASKRKGSTNFFDTKEIEFLLCLINILANSRDMMSYIHVFSHAKGIGNSIAKEIFEALNLLGAGNLRDGILKPNTKIECYKKGVTNAGVGLFGDSLMNDNRSRFDNILSDGFKSHPLLAHSKINIESAIFFNDFYTLYTDSMGISQPSNLIEKIIKTRLFSKFLESLLNERSKNKDGSIDSTLFENKKTQLEQRLAILHNLSKNYKDLRGFINAMVLGSSEFGEGSGVNLLSIHASKGLEFRCVFVIDLMQGRFPNLKLVAKGGSIEEERRLFYVATTRAKEYLFLSFAHNDTGKDITYTPSIFLYEAGLIIKKH